MGNSESYSEYQQAAAEKLIQDDNAKKQELYELHRYIEDPEDLTEDLMDPEPLILPELGYRVELGGNVDKLVTPVLEEVEKHSHYYRDNFCNKGGTPSSPAIISAVQTAKDKSGIHWKILYRNKKGDYIVDLVSKKKSQMVKQLLSIAPDLQGDVPFFEVKDPELIEDLKHMEDRHLIKAYKFGVVYCKENQVDENDMFSNQKKSPEFEEFLEWIGEKIKLKGYKGFRGGLDLQHNTTGIYSYKTEFEGFEIMYHVSTELPYDPENPQQVERKRHIGNDVVVIVFQDGPTGGFRPSTITSKFNHVYVVVQVVKPRERKGSSSKRKQQPRKYRISVVSKQGVRPHGPVLPNNKYLYEKNEETRRFFLTKLINAERAAYYAPGFGQTRSRRLWLKELLEKYSERAEKN